MTTFRRNLIFLLIFLFIFDSYLALVTNEKQFKFSREIKPALEVNRLSIDLRPAPYFLKVKFMDKQNLRAALYFNGSLLKPAARKSKSEITSLNAFIPKKTVGNSNQLLVKFSDAGIPADLDIRISDVKKVIGDDIFIYSKESLPDSNFRLWTFIFLVFIFILLLGYPLLFLRRAGPNTIFKYQLCSFLPFVALIAIFRSAVIFSAYRILMHGVFFIYFWLMTSFIISTFFITKHFLKTVRLKKSNIKSLFFVILINLAIVNAFFLLGEIFTRAYIGLHYKNCPFRLEDIYLGCSYVPNFRGELYGVAATTNSMGMRSPEVGYLKPPGTYRILCLGDSITFGFGVSDDRIYTRQLENMLNHLPGRKYNYQIINLAMPAYNTYQERLIFERRGIKFNPDLAIVGVCLNDLTAGINIPSTVNTLLSFDDYNFEQMSTMNKLKYLLARHSYFFQYLILKYRALIRKYKIIPDEKVGEYGGKEIELCKGKLHNKGQAIFRQEVLKIRDIAKNGNMKLLLVVFPLKMQLHRPDLRWPQLMIGKFATDNHIDFLDLTNAFEGNSAKELFIDTGHPNECGHYLAACGIYDFLKDKGYIKPSRDD